MFFYHIVRFKILNFTLNALFVAKAAIFHQYNLGFCFT